MYVQRTVAGHSVAVGVPVTLPSTTVCAGVLFAPALPMRTKGSKPPITAAKAKMTTRRRNITVIKNVFG
jgi:hypothetical protein